MTTIDWIFSTIQFLIAGVALWVAWKALNLARDAQQDAERERTRAYNHERLMWMQSLLGQLQPLQQERLAPHEIEYGDLQRWMLTCLAVGGLRQDLPKTTALAERPFSKGPETIVQEVAVARAEIHARLEQDSARAYAGELLGW